MQAVVGNVAANLDKADRLVDEAAGSGAGLIILPEFFTSAACFQPGLLDAVQPLNGKVMDFLVSKAKKHQAYVGGSFIAAREGERYNTFVLAMPDGSTALHDKASPPCGRTAITWADKTTASSPRPWVQLGRCCAGSSSATVP